MAEEFKAITTQEELDALIKERLQRQKETYEKKYADYDSLRAAADKEKEYIKAAEENAENLKKLQNELETANQTIKRHEMESMRSNIASEAGLPKEFASRLVGDTEEEIRKDAESLKSIFRDENRRNLPGFTPERSHEDRKAEASKELLEKLKTWG